MDVATHALASLALTRAILPRAPKLLWAWTISAGVIADSDRCSALVSASAYLSCYRTYSHSLLASLIIACALTMAYRLSAPAITRERLSVRSVFAGALLAECLHLAMDTMQWQEVTLLWPFSTSRFAKDWLPSVDPWVIAILVAAVALPEFLHLVSSEIGAKEKRPRGRAGAIIGLSFVFLYTGLRAELHAAAIAQLQNRTYAGELPRRVSAFSESTSLVSWRGVTETESALHQVIARIGVVRRSALDTGINLFKPEPGPLLDAAQNSESARRFLRAARFPKATVQTLDSGAEIEIRDLRYAAAEERTYEPMVSIHFDASGKIASEGIVWATRESSR